MPHPADVTALVAELTDLLGADAVSTADAALDKASADGSWLSPVIKEQLPLGRADVVAFPPDAESIAATVAAAVRHGVPVTPRGKGTGNYGQAIPMAGGLVLDMSRARTIVEIVDGALTADAGATFVELERATEAAGQQILMYPSTARSTIGGFLSGGSGGTGSIRHGVLHRDGVFVRALDVVHAVPDARLVHVEGAEAELYLHNYGTAGIIARATIALEPRQDWHGLFASFEHFEQALSVIRPFADLEPTPRLVSADPVTLSEALPSDPGIPPGRCSLRAIVDAPALDAARALVESAGGRIEDVRPGLGTTLRISMMSYNHPIEWLQKAYPDTYFHVEVQGDALGRPPRRARRGLPGRDAAHRGPEGPPHRHARRAVPQRRGGACRLRPAQRDRRQPPRLPPVVRRLRTPAHPRPRRHHRPQGPPQPRQAARPSDLAARPGRCHDPHLRPADAAHLGGARGGEEALEGGGARRCPPGPVVALRRTGRPLGQIAIWAARRPNLAGGPPSSRRPGSCHRGDGEQSLPLSHLVLTRASLASGLSREAS